MDQEKIDAYNLEQKRKIDEQSAKEVQKDNADGISKTVAASNGMVANIVAQSNKKTQDATKEVGTAVKDAGNNILEAMTNSQNQVAEALNNLVIATVVSKDPQLIQAAKDVTSLISSIAKAGEDFSKSNLNALPSSLDKLTIAIQEMISEDATDLEPNYTTVLDDIKKLLAKDVKEPVVNVSAPNVTVDTSAFEKAIKSLEKTIQANKVVIPKSDSSAVIDAVTGVKNAVEGQRFPVPNYILPFKDINGAATQVQLDATGKLPISASLSGADGAIVDGVSSAIRATVLSLASAKPLTVGIVDGTGTQITSFGGGTQYADGAARGTATGTVVMGDDGTLIQSITAKTLGTQVVSTDTGLVVNAAIHGITTAGGGAYVDVKVTPSGAVSVDGTVTTSGTVTEANSAALLTSSQLLDDTVATLGTTTYTEAATKGNVIGAVRRDANTTLVDTTNEVAPLQVNATGELKVAQIQALPAGTNNIGGVDIITMPAVTVTGVSTLAEQQTQTTALQLIDNAVSGAGFNITQQGGVAVSLNTGVRDVGTQRVTIATNDVVPITDNSGSLTVDAPVGTPAFVRLSDGAAAITTLPVSLAANQSVNVAQINAVTPLMGNGITGTGSQRVTIASDNTAFSVNSTLSAETTKVIGVVRTADGSGNLLTSSTNSLDVNLKTSTITLPVSLASVPSHAVTNAGTFAVQTSATSTGGYTPGKLVSAATTNATVIKASAGTLGHISASNVNAAARYLKFYNKATTPTVGTDVPVLTYIIPGNTAGAGTNIPLPPQGINFSTGISFATTTEATDAGSTGVAVSEIVINYAFN